MWTKEKKVFCVVYQSRNQNKLSLKKESFFVYFTDDPMKSDRGKENISPEL